MNSFSLWQIWIIVGTLWMESWAIDPVHTTDSKSKTSLRGASDVRTDGDQQIRQQERRRHLLHGTTCNLVYMDVEFEPSAVHPKGYSEDHWMCELPQEASSRVGDRKFIDIAEASKLGINETTVTSGSTTMELTQAIVDVDEGDVAKLYVPPDSIVRLRTNSLKSMGTRRLANNVGTLRTLVIRVVDSRNRAPQASLDQLQNDIFDDEASLKSQYKACSYGKLQITPHKGRTLYGQYISNGIVQIKMNYDTGSPTSNYVGMQNAALSAAFRQIGNLNSPVYDLVMFCLPPGTGDWVGYAMVNHKFSFFNDKWCSSVSSQLHEVGHNLGLAHSGQGSAYDDQSGMMGYSYLIDDQRICFNAAKSYQLGWYSDQTLSLDPLGLANPVQTLVLNGVSDYQSYRDENLVVLRLFGTGKDHYIAYNRKDGINADTFEDGDKITIVRKNEGGPFEYGTSTKVGALSLGESYIFENYNGVSGRNVAVKFASLSKDGVNATIEVIDVKRKPSTREDSIPKGTPPPVVVPDCTPIVVEILMDKYPTDISWKFVEKETGKVHATNPSYTVAHANKRLATNVCLPYESSSSSSHDNETGVYYTFVISDRYGDGLCCSQGVGKYRMLDGDGNEIFVGGEAFTTQEHLFKVVPPRSAQENTSLASDEETKTMPSLEEYSFRNETEDLELLEEDFPGNETTNGENDDNDDDDAFEEPICRNDKKRFQIPGERYVRNCNWIATNDRCDKDFRGEPYWKVCRKACKKCE